MSIESMPRIALLTTLALLLAVAPAGATTLDSQRAAFRAALPQAEAGRWAQVEPRLGALEGYPLLPDLRAAWLRSQLGKIDDAEVAAFLARHPDLGFSAGLRRQWANSLARRGAWADYLALYEAHYANSNATLLDCHAFTARIALGRTDGLEEDALRRWLAPVSQPKECDRAFDWLEARGALTAERRRERMELALRAGQFGLARWLARPLGEATVAKVDRWEKLHGKPAAQLDALAQWRDTPADRALLLYGFDRLASTDPEQAAQHWPEFRERFAFGADERAAIDRRIALMHAWRHLPGAAVLLETLPAESHDQSTREWHVRTAIRAQDWTAIDQALGRLEAGPAAEPVWRYWQGRVLESTDRAEAARPIFAELAAERGYYSFMSADRLEADYNWQHARTAANEDLIAALERRPDIVRARELFFTGLEATGRTEWQQALARLSTEERAQAGILATRWGWYSRAITAASGGGVQDDLDLRFPLPWRPVFEEQSRRAGITYQGQRTLLDPDANVALGTTYLAEMLARFDDHRVLATAAYNAGPNRVLRWLPAEGELPAEAWVDSVPFNETRGYVQRVLASEAVFQWRMSGETVRINDSMRPVQPRAPVR